MHTGRGRGLTAAVLTLLCVLLPALVGGAGLDGPPRDGELERLGAALARDHGAAAPRRPTDLYYTAATPAPAETAADALAQARLANVAGLFAISGLLYLLLTLARRRSTGLLACLALAVLPPVWADGAVLRPEVPAACFAGLAMVLLAGFPRQATARRGRGPAIAGWVACVAAMLVIGTAIGLAAACVPSTAVLILVPGGALVLVVGTLGFSAPRLLRRLPLPRVPTVAMQRRLLPWVMLSVVILLMMLLVLRQFTGGDVAATPSGRGVLPAPGLAAVPLLLLAVVGGVRLLLGVGLRLDRARKVSPDTLIVLYAGVLLLQRVFGDSSADALVAAPALAILVAEGLGIVLLLVVGKLMTPTPR